MSKSNGNGSHNWRDMLKEVDPEMEMCLEDHEVAPFLAKIIGSRIDGKKFCDGIVKRAGDQWMPSLRRS